MKAKRRARSRLIVMSILFVAMALAATAGIVAVLALTSRSISSNVNITYTAVDIDGEVEAAYKIGDSGTWTSMNGSSPYRFAADDQTSNKQMNPANIELTSQNRYVEFRYIFRNFGHVDYTAILSLNEVDDNNNMKLEYKYNNNSYTPTGYGLVIEGTNSPVLGKVQTNEDGEEYVEMTYYVKASVKQLTRDANYQSDFFWLLENYEAQPGEETIRLATSEYSDNGDGTFSASYSGANISVANMMSGETGPSIENIWNVPSRFGSASVTKVKPGDELPANTKVVLSDSITTIEEGTFFDPHELQGSLGLVEIVIGNGFTEIPEKAFSWCHNLRNVTLGKNIESIGDAAFGDCRSLTSIEFPNSLKTIGAISFQYTKLINVEIGHSVIGIGNRAFDGCTSLKEITIPSSVTSIGDSAFVGCTGVEVLNYNANVTTDFTSSSNVFQNLGRTAAKTVVNINSTTVPEYLFYNHSTINEVNLLDNVTSIGSYAFNFCSNLTSVTIGDGVTSIGYGAFSESGLTSIEIPDSVTSIGAYAFERIKSLTDITIGSGVTSIGTGAFRSCTNVEVLNYNASVTTAFTSSPFDYLGQNAEHTVVNVNSTTVPNCLFSYCRYIDVVNIGDNVTSIGASVFCECTGLTSVTMGNNVTSIGNAAFYYCSSLTSVVIPDSVTSIASEAFAGCENLIHLTIGKNVPHLSEWQFGDCYKILTIYDRRSTPMTTDDVNDMGGPGSNVRIITSVDDFGEIVQDGDAYYYVMKDSCYILRYDGDDETFEIPNTFNGKSVIGIAEGAFHESKLLSIWIPINVTIINCFCMPIFSHYDNAGNVINIDLYCEASSKPAEWDEFQESGFSTYKFGYTYEEYLAEINK